MSKTLSLLFPASVHAFQSEYDASWDKIYDLAHGFILFDNLSPYHAWPIAMGLSNEREAVIEDICHSMSVARNEAEYLIDNPQLSPTTEKVLRWCFDKCIHPAHVQPGLDHPHYKFHFSVLDAMVQLVRDKPKREIAAILEQKNVSDEDRNLCWQAFRAEERRFKNLQGVKNPETSYLLDVVGNYADTHEYSEVNGAKLSFNKACALHPSIIELGIDLFESMLRGDPSIIQDIENQKESALKEVLALGKILFGPSNVDTSVSKIVKDVKKLDQYDRVDPTTRRMEIERLISQNLQKGFFAICREENKKPWAVKIDFMNAIDKLLIYEARYSKISAEVESRKPILMQFLEWKNHPLVQNHELRALENFLLVWPYLEKSKKPDLLEAPGNYQAAMP